MASVAGLGTTTEFSSSLPYSASETPSHAGARHTQSGYVGTKVSGNTIRPAPFEPASAISVTALPTVASRSRKTGVA